MHEPWTKAKNGMKNIVARVNVHYKEREMNRVWCGKCGTWFSGSLDCPECGGVITTSDSTTLIVNNVDAPTDETIEAMREIESVNCETFDSLDDLFADLEGK